MVEAKERPETMQAQVLRSLRHGLIEGALLPGQVISIRKFAAGFGTSPMPVRDALAQLVAANALQELPNRSVCVPVLSRERIAEIFELRAYLETRAARQACALKGPELAEDLASFHQGFDAEGLRETATKHAILRRNRLFHFALYGAAGNETILPLIESLWLQCGPTLFLTLATSNARAANDAHAEIIEGLRESDPDRVAGALEREIRGTGETLLAQYEEPSLLGGLNFTLR